MMPRNNNIIEAEIVEDETQASDEGLTGNARLDELNRKRTSGQELTQEEGNEYWELAKEEGINTIPSRAEKPETTDEE